MSARSIETVPSDGGTLGTVPAWGLSPLEDRPRPPRVAQLFTSGPLPGRLQRMRPPTWIEPARLIAGRHPCAWGPGNAPSEVQDLLAHGITLFLNLTEDGELEPYAELVPAPVRHVRIPIQDFSVPTTETLVSALDEIDAELAAGGLVYVHCWAGCGRTGVVVGSWLVRHGSEPHAALAKIAETRGLGCPQTLEQRLMILGWAPGR